MLHLLGPFLLSAYLLLSRGFFVDFEQREDVNHMQLSRKRGRSNIFRFYHGET
ncbi:hypothetical protein BN982_01989 [Halobacillus karajensis]|uniref:Uncharacterized protein n=1 Tax=Halobacillus karajensis TaxID=195088 RepID=A0A024P3E5_9BACI|nr:hypothetical protein BN982_01989 [Halobacillus karajensis]CDQ22147.1 hypothetical protein BN983_00350 [Halobacillus karajensis]CDQ27988.1 hypothetical protein BN981_02277 [Halobacillus karajensis]